MAIDDIGDRRPCKASMLLRYLYGLPIRENGERAKVTDLTRLHMLGVDWSIPGLCDLNVDSLHELLIWLVRQTKAHCRTIAQEVDEILSYADLSFGCNDNKTTHMVVEVSAARTTRLCGVPMASMSCEKYPSFLRSTLGYMATHKR
jgi:hypothetical protein